MELNRNRREKAIQAVIDCIWADPGSGKSDAQLFDEYVEKHTRPGKSREMVCDELALGIACIIEGGNLA